MGVCVSSYPTQRWFGLELCVFVKFALSRFSTLDIRWDSGLENMTTSAFAFNLGVLLAINGHKFLGSNLKILKTGYSA